MATKVLVSRNVLISQNVEVEVPCNLDDKEAIAYALNHVWESESVDWEESDGCGECQDPFVSDINREESAE